MTRPLAPSLLLVAALCAPAAAAVTVSPQGEAAQNAKVCFRYKPASKAGSVHLAGSFNGWKLDRPMQDQDGDGTWELELELGAGKHEYKFVVDQKDWQLDPDNPERAKNDQGGENSVVTVGGGAARGGAGQGGEQKPGGFGSTQVRKQQRVFTGEVHFIPKDTKRLPDFNQSKPQGRIYAECFDIAPRSFSDGFPGLTDRFEWFAIRYRGTFKVEKTGRYKLRLLSDDGARLFIDGKLALDNDGLHGPKEVARIVKLKEGEHKLVLDYMQGPALEVALQLYITRPDSTQEEPLKASSVPVKEEKGTKER
ncbi:MAG: PA14 domain-containing protein [Planctomycetota bacterium]